MNNIIEGNNDLTHLQIDLPVMTFEKWFSELTELFAEAWKIDKIMACRKLSESGCKQWYDDGFTPYCTFRETFIELY